MATFTTNAGKAGNMLLAFAFPEFGIEGIALIPVVNTVYAGNVTDFNPDLLVIYQVGMTFAGTTPTGGTFTTLTIALSGFSAGDLVGTLTGITRPNNFVEIDDINNYRILDGDDTLNGNTLSDDLTGGFGGSDIFNGGGGNDRFYVAGLGVTPTHQFNGAAGSTDEIIVKANIYTGATELNLRSSTFASIEKLTLEAGVSVLLNASQFGAGGLASGLAISGPAGSTVTIAKDIGGPLDLGALAVAGATLTVNGSAASELIIGTTGGDTLLGLDGADTLGGGGGNDTLSGDGGDDTVDGGSGGDTMRGGAGNDTYTVDDVGDVVDETPAGSDGADAVLSSVNVNLGSGVAKLVSLAPAATGLGAIENITLTGSAVEASGNDLANVIIGNGVGNRLAGGLGADLFTGGAGGDSFLFFSLKDSGKKASARDTILDFTPGDLIDLSAIDAKKGGSDNPFKFIGKQEFHEKKGELHFEKKKGDVIVSGDVDGNGKADFSILLDAVNKVAKADFVL